MNWLIENTSLKFILTGSSARKLGRVHANLFAGRALKRELRPLYLYEAHDEKASLEYISRTGMLPPHFNYPSYQDLIRAYIVDYLKEEIALEAQVQQLPQFADFNVLQQSHPASFSITLTLQEKLKY